MSVSQVMPVVMAVVKSKPVILATIAVFLYVDFVFFVARYKKQPKVKSKRPAIQAAPAPAAEASSEATEDSGGADEE